jgi:mRNA interferase RelE/StbE
MSYRVAILRRAQAGRNGWCIRVGDYRVIYDTDDDEQAVIILHIGHRQDIYR